MSFLLITIIVLALAFDYINGFHDAANSIATIVSTKVLTPLQAVLWAALFNFVAFFIFKDHGVANTIAKTVHENAITLQVIMSGLLAAITWNLITWWFGIPSSSSHTLIGGFGGAAIANAGFLAINPEPIINTVSFIVLAPFIGMLLAYIISLWFIYSFGKGATPKIVSSLVIVGVFVLLKVVINTHPKHAISDNESVNILMDSHNFKWFLLGLIMVAMAFFTMTLSSLNTATANVYLKRFQLVSSAIFSIGHGGNDAQKVMGIITVALISGGQIKDFDQMPVWVPLACYTAIAAGTMSGGWKIIKTMGSKITKVTPFEGVAAETAGAITLFLTENLKIPVST
ncbi:MAG: inorganic phosphate transporter, partial [Chitinophagia bacterium]|nr:inorganic phosphate transporter [Chitinophagia bacterium]